MQPTKLPTTNCASGVFKSQPLQITLHVTYAEKSAAPVAANVASLFSAAPHTAPLWPSNVPIQSPVSPCRNIGFPSVKRQNASVMKRWAKIALFWNSTVVGSRKSLSPRIKSSNDDFYTNRRSDKFSITYPKSAEIRFGEKYLSLFQKTYFVGKIHNLQIFPMAHQHLSTHQECADLLHARKLLTRDASKASV